MITIEDLEPLIPDPVPVPPFTMSWAKVTQTSPLRVRLDGSSEDLPFTPVSLIGEITGTPRVMCLRLGAQLCIIGAVGGTTPAGVMAHFGGQSAPAGWLLCQGQTVSRAAYARLFAAVGVQYGAGDGTTTFRLPDGRGRTLVGQDAGQTEFATPGQAGGAKTHTLTTNQMPVHGHYAPNGLYFYVEGPDGSMRRSNPVVNAGASGEFGTWRQRLAETAGLAPLPTASAGGGEPHNNLQPYLVTNVIIKI